MNGKSLVLLNIKAFLFAITVETAEELIEKSKN